MNKPCLTSLGENSVGWVRRPCDAYSRLWLKVLMDRGGAGDPTSSSNIGEEYHTSERMVNVVFVYVLNRHGQPLMPCRPRKARLLVQAGKAKVVRMGHLPFGCSMAVRDTRKKSLLGVDAGTKHIGISATTEQAVLFESEVKPRLIFRSISPLDNSFGEHAEVARRDIASSDFSIGRSRKAG